MQPGEGDGGWQRDLGHPHLGLTSSSCSQPGTGDRGWENCTHREPNHNASTGTGSPSRQLCPQLPGEIWQHTGIFFVDRTSRGYGCCRWTYCSVWGPGCSKTAPHCTAAPSAKEDLVPNADCTKAEKLWAGVITSSPPPVPMPLTGSMSEWREPRIPTCNTRQDTKLWSAARPRHCQLDLGLSAGAGP